MGRPESERHFIRIAKCGSLEALLSMAASPRWQNPLSNLTIIARDAYTRFVCEFCIHNMYDP